MIPARGGSKGVKRKNILPLAGRPLITHTIEAAQAASCVSRLIVTTDDGEIAQVAKQHGCEVHMRSPRLATDTTPMVPVLLDVLDSVVDVENVDIVLVLQPTSPFRTAEDIDEAIHDLVASSADSIVSVYEVGDCHPSRMYRLSDNHLCPLAEESPSRLRQDVDRLYHRNGAIYACRTYLLREQRRLIGSDPLAYVMPRERSVNIDDSLDWVLAQALAEQPPATRDS